MIAAMVAIVLLAVGGAVTSADASPKAGQDGTQACASDGQTYTVRGHIVAPVGQLGRGKLDTTTLYLDGLSFGECFSSFQQATSDNYAGA